MVIKYDQLFKEKFIANSEIDLKNIRFCKFDNQDLNQNFIQVETQKDNMLKITLSFKHLDGLFFGLHTNTDNSDGYYAEYVEYLGKNEVYFAGFQSKKESIIVLYDECLYESNGTDKIVFLAPYNESFFKSEITCGYMKISYDHNPKQIVSTMSTTFPITHTFKPRVIKIPYEDLSNIEAITQNLNKATTYCKDLIFKEYKKPKRVHFKDSKADFNKRINVYIENPYYSYSAVLFTGFALGFMTKSLFQK